MPFAAPGQSIVTVGGRRQVVGSPASAAKTYAEFQAHITTLAVDGVGVWTGLMATGTASRARKTTAAALSGNMEGSTWGPSAPGVGRSNAVLCRALQHAFPDQPTFQDQITNGLDIFYRTQEVTASALPSVNRNGYTSTASAVATLTAIIVEYIAWIGGMPMRGDPVAGTAPTPYTW